MLVISLEAIPAAFIRLNSTYEEYMSSVHFNRCFCLDN
jgi:hypothetical protein